MTMMEIHRSVPGGEVRVQGGMVLTEFFDGAKSVFDPGSCDHRLKEAARTIGYGDQWERYGIDHELAHHFVATALQWPCSSIIWQSAHSGRRPPGWRRDGEWPYAGWDEEHLVNSLLRLLQTGAWDEIVADVWGERTPLVLAHLQSWIRPWIARPDRELPLPLRPDLVSFPLVQEVEEEIPMGREALRAWA